MIYRTWKKTRAVVVRMLIGMATQPMLARSIFGAGAVRRGARSVRAWPVLSLTGVRENTPCFWQDGPYQFIKANGDVYWVSTSVLQSVR